MFYLFCKYKGQVSVSNRIVALMSFADCCPAATIRNYTFLTSKDSCFFVSYFFHLLLLFFYRGNVLSQQNKVTLQGDQVPSDKNNPETLINEAEQNSVNQRCTPPRPSSSLLALSHDCLALGDGEIENYILDNTELSLPSLISFNESQNKDQQKETPSKFLHQSSPIPKIPLSMSKRAKQSAEILNSNNKIIEKKNKTEKVKKTSVMKQTKKTNQLVAKTRLRRKKGDYKKIKNQNHVEILPAVNQNQKAQILLE